VDGLELETLEDFPADEARVRHWRAIFFRADVSRRPSAAG
jgi:hypothetical protein